MSYKISPLCDKYGPRKGLEGPFTFGGGRILYYDTKEGKYWDPKTDFYISDEELGVLQGFLFQRIKG